MSNKFNIIDKAQLTQSIQSLGRRLTSLREFF